MGYKSSKGPQQTGDIQYQADPTDTQIDFADDYISLKTHGEARLTVQGTAGYVGIGTVTPTHNLTIVGATSGSATLEIVGPTTLGDTLNVTGSTVLADTLTVTGNVTGSSGLKALADGLSFPLRTVTAGYVVLLQDYTILVDTSGGDVTVTLPSAPNAIRKLYNIKKIDASNTLTIATPAAGTIDGAASKDLTTLYESVTLQCDGTNWHII